MSSQLKSELQHILQHALETNQFERAEEAMSYLKDLAQMEAFAKRYFDQSITYGNGGSQEKRNHGESSVNKRDIMSIYYIEEDNIFKFKKYTQTYMVSYDFFEKFLHNLEYWKDKKPFSSKDYFDTFSRDLQRLSTYQSSTMRQFITLLFRFAYELGALVKPEPPQRNRFVVAETLNTDQLLQDLKDKKIVEFGKDKNLSH
ncbi:hypothetical protein ACFPTR_05710 [Aliibacillus thermotolerans]|uniref:Phage integrase SAM-like domain-containing protein n=1 Tax=Aliibacillus thermotolerans TaxID=1834418 RepID=A0ABW0U4S2_9BACI|nr:hypothetical protein [Aliibacillus thermotolerans]MDA3130883.1 hypothetical protein [Aliibacillus thermotolerans]